MVEFEEGSLKRFDAADYQLDAFAEVSSPNMISGFVVTGTARLVTDNHGRVSGNIATTVDVLPQVARVGAPGRGKWSTATSPSRTSRPGASTGSIRYSAPGSEPRASTCRYGEGGFPIPTVGAIPLSLASDRFRQPQKAAR